MAGDQRKGEQEEYAITTRRGENERHFYPPRFGCMSREPNTSVVVRLTSCRSAASGLPIPSNYGLVNAARWLQGRVSQTHYHRDHFVTGPSRTIRTECLDSRMVVFGAL